MKEFNKNSIGGVINEYGEPADLRNKQGRRHLLKSILALMLIGYLCGKTSYRSICYLFRPDLAIKDGMKKKSSKPRVAEVDKDNTWYKDKEKAIKEAEEKAQKIYSM